MCIMEYTHMCKPQAKPENDTWKMMKMASNGANKQYIWMPCWLLTFAQASESGCAREIEGKRYY